MKKLGTMDKILVLCGVFIVIFVAVMIFVFLKTSTEMSTLETCVFGAVFGECGVLGVIKVFKLRAKDKDGESSKKHEDEMPQEVDE